MPARGESALTGTRRKTEGFFAPPWATKVAAMIQYTLTFRLFHAARGDEGGLILAPPCAFRSCIVTLPKAPP